MIAQRVFVAIVCVATCLADPSVYPEILTTQYLSNPLAVDTPYPRLSWTLSGKLIHFKIVNNLTQIAYQIRAASQLDILLEKPDLWDTGKVNSSSQVGIRYEGKLPGPGKRIYWTVRVWDQDNQSSEYANASFWDNAYNVSQWTAHWISAPVGLQKKALSNISAEDSKVISTHNGLKPVVVLRKRFTLDLDIKTAKAYATARGMYRLFINDKAGLQINGYKPLLTPGWTDYNQSIQYQVYDVTKYIRSKNTIGVILGTGWFSGYIGGNGEYGHYGKNEAFLMELHIEYTNGTQIKIKSDNTWKANTGPLVYSDLYHGELFYENRSLYGWLDSDYDDSKWSAVDSVVIDKNISLVAEQAKPIGERFNLPVDKSWESSPGVWVFDFGLNIVGYVAINLTNFSSNAKIQVRHAEVPYPNGFIYTLNFGAALAKETYVLKLAIHNFLRVLSI